MGIKERVKGLGVKGLAVIMALIVVASAATVAYLSTAATANVTVTSPFDLKFAAGTVGASSDLMSLTTTVTGASTFNVDATLKNNANNMVKASTKLTCVGADLTCDYLKLKDASQSKNSEGKYVSDYASTETPCTTTSTGVVYTFTRAVPSLTPGSFNFPAEHESKSQVEATFVPVTAGGVTKVFTGAVSCELQAFPEAV